MKLSGLRFLIFLVGMVSCFQWLEAATFLGKSSNVREKKDDDDYKTYPSGGAGYSYSDGGAEADAAPAIIVEDSEESGGYGPLKALYFDDVPEDWVPGRVRAGLEIGLQHWEPYSRSGQYVSDYDIDPVTVTEMDTAIRVKSWVFMVDYKTSLTDPENMKNLLAQVSRINPGEGVWWSLYAERGQVEGTASTEDEFGTPVEYPVDTEWNRIGIELRTFPGIFAGLVYEDLTMPVIHTFNNEEIAFAVFDDQTRARTLSINLGYDKALRLLNDFKEGGAFAWSLEGSLGGGWLTYSKDEARDFIEAQGYELESVDFLIAGSVEGRIGYTYSKTWLNTDVQLYAGFRLRASGWMNTVGNPPDPDTVELETGFGLLQPGVFGRISLQW